MINIILLAIEPSPASGACRGECEGCHGRERPWEICLGVNE